jgi:hypothetical protein
MAVVRELMLGRPWRPARSSNLPVTATGWLAGGN